MEERPTHFMSNALSYNHMLCFAAMGIENDQPSHGFEPLGPNAAVTIRGRTYHSIRPQSESTTNSMLGYLFFESTPASSSKFVDEQIVEVLLYSLKRENSIAVDIFLPMCDVLRQIDETDSVQQLEIFINGTSTSLDCSILRNDTAGDRVIRCKPKQGDASISFYLHHPMTEPLTYPLLFTRGEFGWSKDGMQVPKRTYIASRYLRCEPLMLIPSLMYPDQHHIITNRFQAFHRLGQIYAVDQVSGMLDNQLNFLKRNQNRLMGGEKQGGDGIEDDDASDDGENDGPKGIPIYTLIHTLNQTYI
jgi:hypothetical protein